MPHRSAPGCCSLSSTVETQSVPFDTPQRGLLVSADVSAEQELDLEPRCSSVLAKGTRVRLVNLATGELNGCLGTVENFDLNRNGRYGIHLDEKDVVVAIRPSNVESLDAPVIGGLSDVNEPAARRAGVDIVAVIDRSFSMGGKPFELVQESLSFCVDQSSSDDRLCFVTFGSEATLVMSLTRMSAGNKAHAHRLIKAMKVDGCTALSDGVFTALGHLRSARKGSFENRAASVILFTDGQANCGVTQAPELVRRMEQQYLATTPRASAVSVHCVGLGPSHDEKMLTTIADSARGQYFFVEAAGDIPRTFEDCFGGVFSTIATDARVEIVPEHGVAVLELLAGKYKTGRTGAGSTFCELGELRAGESKNIPFSISLSTLKSPNPAQRVLKLCFTYVQTSDQKLIEQTLDVVVDRSRQADSNLATAEPQKATQQQLRLDEQRNRVAVATALDHAANAGVNAGAILRAALDAVHVSISHSSPLSLQLADSLEKAIEFSRTGGSSISPKMLFAMSRSHFNQRSSGISVGSAQLYLSKQSGAFAPSASQKAGAAKPHLQKSRTSGGTEQKGQRRALADSGSSWGAKEECSDDEAEFAWADCESSDSDGDIGDGDTLPVSRQEPCGLVFVNNGGSLHFNGKPQPHRVQTAEAQRATGNVPSAQLGRAIRRLITDYEELQRSPVLDGVAAPIEDDVFEWHGCLFARNSGALAVHFVMFFSSDYPKSPPKLFLSSFVRHSHVFGSWVCLDLLEEHEFGSDAEAGAPYTGWSSAYTVHGILLQLSSFLFSEPMSLADERKMRLSAEKFVCDRCPHIHDVPWPARPRSDGSAEGSKRTDESQDNNAALSLLPTVDHLTSYRDDSDDDNNNTSGNNVSCAASTSHDAWSSVPQAVFSPNALAREQPRALSVSVSSTKSWAERLLTSGSSHTVKRRQGASLLVKDPTARVEHVDRGQQQRAVAQRPRTYAKVSSQRGCWSDVARGSKSPQAAAESHRVPQFQNRHMPISLAQLVRRVESLAPKTPKPTGQVPFFWLDDSLIVRVLCFVASSPGGQLSVDFAAASSVCRRLFRLSHDASLWDSLFCQLLPMKADRFTSGLGRPVKASLLLNARSVAGWKHVVFGERSRAAAQLICFHSKQTWKETTLGIPVAISRKNRSRVVSLSEDYAIDTVSSPFDLLSFEAFSTDQVRLSVWKLPFDFWLPLFIDCSHMARAVDTGLLQTSIARMCIGNASGLEDRELALRFEQSPEMSLVVLPKLMNSMVVSMMSGDLHTSIVAMQGYCAVHRLLYYLVHESQWSPILRTSVNSQAEAFRRGRTHKSDLPNLGDFLATMSVADSTTWNDIRVPYLLENFDRNAMWAIRRFPWLGNTRPNAVSVRDRVDLTWEATVVSMKLLSFHVYFFKNIARPESATVGQVAGAYDVLFGRPSEQQQLLLQQHCKKVLRLRGWEDWFASVGMKKPSDTALSRWLVDSVKNSERKAYHTSYSRRR